MTVTFRRQHRFATENPQELQRQLTELEASIEEAIRSIERNTMPRGKRYDVRGGETVDALVGCLYVCDTTSGNITLRLEEPKADHENSFVFVWKTSASNSITLAPVNALIDDAATLSLSSKAHYDISADGRNYRREY